MLPRLKMLLPLSKITLIMQKQSPKALEIGVLENFAKFTGKYLCESLFFNKVAGLRSATLFKRETDTGVFL